jgi:hypothetical protein
MLQLSGFYEYGEIVPLLSNTPYRFQNQTFFGILIGI